jgi:hypothetical protein
VDASGNPLNLGNLYTYTAGSSTPETTYTTSLGNVANANPIVLNSNGYPASGGSVVSIWLTEGVAYKFELQNAAGTVIWTRDNIEGINDSSSSQDQWVAGPAPTYVSATSFTLVGDQTAIFHIGRRLKTTNTGGTIYSTIVNSAFGASTTVTVVNDSGSLDSGLSAVSYGVVSAANTSEPFIGDTYVCEGRLTLTSGTPVTITDVTAAETVYFAPFRGNAVDIYDATAMRWVRYKISQLSVDVPDATQMNDVFIYNNAGTLTLDVTAWTNDTTRATALTTQDGVLVKSGATGRRYIGSFYSTTAGNGQTEDSIAKRYVWNYYNRVDRSMRVVDATNSWVWTTDTWQQANASAANQIEYVQGFSEDPVTAEVFGTSTNATATASAAVGIGLDVTNADSSQIRTPGTTINQTTVAARQTHVAKYVGFPGVGRHFLAWIERSEAAGTTTWYGDNGGLYTQAGISGVIKG